ECHPPDSDVRRISSSNSIGAAQPEGRGPRPGTPGERSFIMFRTLRMSALAALVLLAMTAGPAWADEVIADVPFAFTVNGQTLPAGTYRVDRDVTDPLLLIV